MKLIYKPSRAAMKLLNMYMLLSVVVTSCATTGLSSKLSYPPAKKSAAIDEYHGERVADPYRWMEDAEAPETKAWVAAQNRLTAQYVRTPVRNQIKKQLTQLWNYPRLSFLEKQAGRYFFSRNSGLQNQSVFYVQDSLDIEPKVVLDPNLLSEDGTTALTGGSISHDGKYFAYLLSSKGSDWQVLRVRNVDTGEDLPEVLEWCKFTSVTWKPDGSGFFYNRLPDPDSVPSEDRNALSRVYWHQLNTAQKEDRLVYEYPQDKELSFRPTITDDGKFLLLYAYRGTNPKNMVYYRKVESEGPFVHLLDQADARYVFLGNQDTLFYFQTDLDAPRVRIVAIDTLNPEPQNWKEIIAQQEDTLAFARLAGGRLVVVYMHHAHHLLKVFGLDGRHVREVSLPGIGSVRRLTARQDDQEMFLEFTSFLIPESCYRYDLAGDRLTVFHAPKMEFDPSEFMTKQVFYKSADSTRIPMFITHKKDIRLNGDNPTLLYGYGGFNVNLTPRFLASTIMWIKNGGVFAAANLRGGGEYGSAWHQSGVLGNKQNVFDDFIAAAEWLVEKKYTRSSRLAIQGASNGGLLTAACMIQRPDLYGAVVSQVPVTDMLRYHKFTIGRYWVSDYGNAEEYPEHFKFLYAYSPLHNIRADTKYPPALITTADTDDRVVPLHAKKFAATLQALHSGDDPILLRVQTKAGHGRGKPTSMLIEEQADIYAFLFKVFDIRI